MISATAVELRAGARLLLEAATFQVSAGDKIGLVGRNGAGKTTLARVLAGEAGQAAGEVRISGSVGYLPQDTRVGNLEALAMDRVLSARGLDALMTGMRAAEVAMSDADPARRDAAVRRYGHLEERLPSSAGMRPSPRRRRSPPASACRRRCSGSHCARCPAGSGGGSSWPGSCSAARRRCCSTSQLTTWTPTRCPGCASLRAFRGGLVVISHDTALLENVVNKVFHLDADRSVLDIYNLGWKAYLEQRETDARRRRRERVNASARPRRCNRRRTRCGPRPPRRGPRRACKSARRNCSPGSVPTAGRTRSPGCASRCPRTAARRR